MTSNFPKFDVLMHWITERHNIFVKRSLGKPSPWTADPILQAYRFCNVYRENDKVTKWIARNWRNSNRNDPDLWFAMLVARYINEPGTMALLGYPVPWIPRRFTSAVEIRKEQGKNVFNAAYIISTGGLSIPKHEYLSSFFTRVWENRKRLRPREAMTLREYCDLLVAERGLGRFMVGQIIADLKYVQLRDAKDWWSFAISGPGSRRGMNRLMGNPVKQNWREEDWFEELKLLRKIVNANLPRKMEPLHGQDLQNCLCEFDKYLRAKTGEGRPKQKFQGA